MTGFLTEADKACSEAIPTQPVYRDEEGVLRFRKNSFVRYLLEYLPGGMNTLAQLPDMSREEFKQLWQLTGISFQGYLDVFPEALEEDFND